MATRPNIFLSAAACLLLAAGTEAANLVKPVFPETKTLELVEVDVVARANAVAGKPENGEIAYNQNGAPFGEAAKAALAASTFDGDGPVNVWYHYRMGQDTIVTVLPPAHAQNLESEPVLVKTVAPTFPPGAPSLSTSIELEILTGPTGAVWYIRATNPAANALYVERAVAAAKQYEFEPGTRGGAAVPAWYTCVIDFR